MTENPKIVTGPMVRAILEGRKTQYRELAKLSDDAPRLYGEPGDRLWVQEVYLIRGAGGGVDYRADFAPLEAAVHGTLYGGWKLSNHMPRWASRITLEVVGVRVERVQDISEADAIAEGIPASVDGARWAFPEIWESVHGHGSWAKNFWVRVVEFKHITP